MLNGVLNAVIFIFTCSISSFIFGFLHELGHIAMYRIFGGNNDWSITIGTGNPIIKTKKVTINLLFMIPGFVNWSITKVKKIHAVLWFSGGFLINSILAIAILLVILHLRFTLIPGHLKTLQTRPRMIPVAQE